MESEPQAMEKRAPVFGILSILAPFAGVGLAFIADKANRLLYPNDDHSMADIVAVGLPIYAGFVGGVILSIIAAARDEKLRALGWIGFLLCAIPLLGSCIFSRN
jgi:O-antigen/teichoic acid export membrane protein